MNQNNNRKADLLQPVNLSDKQAVQKLQKLINNFNLQSSETIALKEDGIYGQKTKAAFYQIRETRGLSNCFDYPIGIDVEVLEHPLTAQICQNHLSQSQYYPNENTDKKGICLHHTATSGNAEAIRNGFERDSRRVGVHFCVGGFNPKQPESDGQIMQLLPLLDWAHHLNTSDNNEHHNKQIIGIEICSFGALDYNDKDGKFYTNSSQPVVVDEAQVCDLGYFFNGYRYFQKYTEKQCMAVLALLCYLRDIFHFDYSKLNLSMNFFERNDNTILLKTEPTVITAHTSWRRLREKSDIYPNLLILKVLESVKLHNNYACALDFYNKNRTIY